MEPNVGNTLVILSSRQKVLQFCKAFFVFANHPINIASFIKTLKSSAIIPFVCYG